MVENIPPCERCRSRAGSDDREGLVARLAGDFVQDIGKALSFFTCEVCASAWTLVEELGTGRPAFFLRDLGGALGEDSTAGK